MDPFGAIAVLIPFGGMATGIVFMVIVYKLVSRWSDRKQVVGHDELVAEVARLRAELNQMVDVSDRVQELEERVDFAERMLAQSKHDRLPAGG